MGLRTESGIQTNRTKCCPRNAILHPSLGGQTTRTSGPHGAEKAAEFGLSQGKAILLNTPGTQPTSRKGGCLRSKCHTVTVTAHPRTERDLHGNTMTRHHLTRGQKETHTAVQEEEVTRDLYHLSRAGPAPQSS